MALVSLRARSSAFKLAGTLSALRFVSSSSKADRAIPVYADYGAAGTSGSDGALNMLMFGKPGAGKGTLSSKFMDKYRIHFVSTGDPRRQHIAEKSTIGKEPEARAALRVRLI